MPSEKTRNAPESPVATEGSSTTRPGLAGVLKTSKQAKGSLILWPREHGAWGMLLFPYVSAILLTGVWSWTFIPASIAALAAFLIREPLAVLARQRFVWARERPETAIARRSAIVWSTVLAGAGIWLLLVLPVEWMIVLAAAGLVMTASYVFAVVRNRQRSVLFQLAGAAGLSGSALLGYLAGDRSPDETLFLLWLVHAVHTTGSVLTVHALIDARIARAKPRADSPRKRDAVAWHAVQFAVAGVLVIADERWLAAAVVLPWAIHAADLARLEKSPYLERPLRNLGFRELGLSFCFSAIVLAGLWRS